MHVKRGHHRLPRPLGDHPQPAGQWRRQRYELPRLSASFYESVALRQAAATCDRDTDNARNLAVLDSEVDAFNNLLATKCGG